MNKGSTDPNALDAVTDRDGDNHVASPAVGAGDVSSPDPGTVPLGVVDVGAIADTSNLLVVGWLSRATGNVPLEPALTLHAQEQRAERRVNAVEFACHQLIRFRTLSRATALALRLMSVPGVIPKSFAEPTVWNVSTGLPSTL